MLKKSILLCFTCLCSLMAWGQSKDYAHFQALLNRKDTAALRKFIPQWEQRAGQSGDIYAAWCNLLLMEARHDVLQLSADTAVNNGLLLTDSTGNKAGSITDQVYYDAKTMHKLYQKFAEGLAKHPDRLDLWFGKIHVQLLENHPKEAVETMKQVIDRSVINHQKWLWTNDKSTPSAPEEFFFSTLQDYFRQLYDAQEDDVNMSFVDHVLKNYPKNIYFLNNKAALLSAKGEKQEALKVLLQLYQLAPDDDIVVANIATLSKETGNKKQAMEFYKKLLKSTDEDIRNEAKHELGVKD